jgi:8-oxo-dGTP pyrophosphatase MutT (NUDIX family)
MHKPIVVASRPIHLGKVIRLSIERLRYANGREYDLEFVRHPGAAAVVPVDDQGRICVVQQYRHGIGEFLWEIPAGKLDPGEAPADCAVRELAEETGVAARDWTALGRYLPAPGLFTEVIHLYLARGLTVGPPRPDPDEDLELKWLPFKEALQFVEDGSWEDGKTAVALLRAARHLQL